MSDMAVSINNVSKSFRLPHEKADSVKSLFVNPFNPSRRKFETQHALKNISFDIQKGEFFGIVGRNGSGKSTLLKIIAGIYQPNKGNVHVNGRLVPFIELGVGFNPQLTGRENVYLNGALLGFSETEVDDKYQAIVDFAELERFMDQKLRNYSSGMQVRLAFSVATILADSDILLIDEVLAVGDADFQRKCFGYFKKLKKEKKTVVFVSHDMAAVREYCDRAVLIDDNELRFMGETSSVAKEYTKMFQSYDSDKSEQKKSHDYDEKRWGTGQAKFSKIGISKQKGFIEIELHIVSCENIDRLVYGVHINGPDGNELTASNNRMIGAPDIDDLSVGNKVCVKWKMQDIFSDGRYTVTATLVNSAGVVYDWVSEAECFDIKKAERSTTSVIPEIKVTINKGRDKSV